MSGVLIDENNHQEAALNAVNIEVHLGLREGFNKKTLKVMEFSIQISPPPTPLRWKKKHLFSTIFVFVFIMFLNTKFGENFEEKIDICFY